ncbi:MAG: tripartite tricarboxylate transporter TctB family protein [Reyranellaceae bacterium]
MVKRPASFALGIVSLAFALLILWQSRSLPLGAPNTPGHGFFPFVLGVLIAVLAAFCIASAFVGERETIALKYSVRGPFFVLLAPLVFALTIERLGLFVAVVGVVLTASAALRFRWKSALVLAAVLAISCAALFVYALDLHLPLLWKR